MSARIYPRIGSDTAAKAGGQKCRFSGCSAKATRRIFIEVNWFRGDDELALSCEAHRKDAAGLLAGVEAFAAEQKAKREAKERAAQ